MPLFTSKKISKKKAGRDIKIFSRGANGKIKEDTVLVSTHKKSVRPHRKTNKNSSIFKKERSRVNKKKKRLIKRKKRKPVIRKSKKIKLRKIKRPKALRLSKKRKVKRKTVEILKKYKSRTKHKRYRNK